LLSLGIILQVPGRDNARNVVFGFGAGISLALFLALRSMWDDRVLTAKDASSAKRM
jgi:capsular polysaccharide biosynthesis protein